MFPCEYCKMFKNTYFEEHLRKHASEGHCFIGKIFNVKVLKLSLMVNLKLPFKNWFFYNLIILIKLYKIWYLNLDKVLFFQRNQVICLKNWNFDELQLPQSLIFLLKLCTRFLLKNLYKRVFGIFFIFDLQLLMKM